MSHLTLELLRLLNFALPLSPDSFACSHFLFQVMNLSFSGTWKHKQVADPDFELRWGPGFGLFALPAFLPSVISSFFTQNKGGGGRAPWASPLDPPL